MKRTDIDLRRADDALGETTTALAARILCCDARTLYAMRDRGEIKFSLTASGRHLWRVREYLARAEARGA
jgi:hypothetical protein